MNTVSKVSYLVCSGLENGKEFCGWGMTAGRESKLGLTGLYSILIDWGIGWGIFCGGIKNVFGGTLGVWLILMIWWLIGWTGIMYCCENVGNEAGTTSL